jgi:hypothetical protein
VGAARGLDEVRLDYLFLDASFFRMHPGSPTESAAQVLAQLRSWRGWVIQRAFSIICRRP